MKKVLICISGYPGSGKSIFADVGVDLGIPVLRMGDVIREVSLKKYGKIDKDTLAKASIEIRNTLGNNAVAILLARKIKSMEDKIIIIDGIRSMDEVKELSKAGETIVISLIASREKRLNRLRLRRREDDTLDPGDFIDRDHREKTFGMDVVLENTDIFVYNEDITIDELRSIARKIFTDIEKNVYREGNREEEELDRTSPEKE